VPFLRLCRSAVIRALPVPVRRAVRFRQTHGRLPSLRHPRTFNEKVTWRIVHDRRPILAWTCDKLAMKEHAGRVAPNLVRIPETLWFGTDLAELTAVDLPARWVLKPNHASQLVLIGEGPPDPVALTARTEGWALYEHWRKNDEWAYKMARPGLLVEEFIGDGDDAPADFKVLVCDGIPRIIAVHTNRGRGHQNRLYTPDWEPLPWTGGYPPGPDAARPQRLAEMLKASEVLAAGFDMLRVDFYEHDGVLWFGELTPYPGAGRGRIEPELDALQGSWWTLPALQRRRLGRSRLTSGRP
jgi:hypothetical protein